MSEARRCDYCPETGPCAVDTWLDEQYLGIPLKVHETEPVKYGRRKEREAIVAWLLEVKRGDLPGRYLASFIERGDHLEDEDEG